MTGRRERLRKALQKGFELRGKSDEEAAESGRLLPRTRRIWRSIGPLRFVSTLLLLILALLIARFSWAIPLTDEIERVLFDFRASYAMEAVEEDERILLVVYDEQTLINTEVRSPLDREILANALTNLNAMNPRAIGIDILVDQSTPNDQLLVDALTAMDVPTFLAFVSSRYNPEEIRPDQEDFLADIMGRIDNDQVNFTSVFMQTDDDNVSRRWPMQPRDLPPFMAMALAPGNDAWQDHRGSIAFRRSAYEGGFVFTQLPIDFIAEEGADEGFRELVEGRYVLIGSDIQDRDRFLTPISRLTGGDTTAGVAVHAHLLAQMLDGNMTYPLPRWALWVTAFFVVVAGALTSIGDFRLWKLSLFILAQAVFFLVVPFLLHDAGTDTRNLPVFGWSLGWVVAFTSVGAAARSVGAEKRQFVQGALAKYLPGDVANQLISDPDRLSLHGEKREIFAVFTDLEGFTKLSHAIEPEMVANLLNNYLDILSEVVLENGGTLDKYVGDAVVAFWGAPISRPDDAERAAKCALEMWQMGEAFRESAPEGVPPIGRTRVGLHFGDAIVGNFGGQDRIQYTALGDAMNTAARLESANKHLDTSVLVSESVVSQVSDMEFRPLGRVTLSGRSTPVEIYEPVLDVTMGSAKQLHKLYRKYEEGDTKAADEIAALARENPDDAALQNFAERLRQTEPGGTYVLQGK